MEDDHFFANSTNSLVSVGEHRILFFWYGIFNCGLRAFAFLLLQSDSTYVPIKPDTISGTESDDSSIKSVRFNKLAEVREMSQHEANEALMSRLSYSATIRVRRQKTYHKTARTALMFCILVSIFFFC